MLVLKLKGIKSDFSKDPVDYKKIRKEDVPLPKGRFFKQDKVKRFKILDSTITEIAGNKNAKKLLIFIHGGAFISGPAKHHWDTIKTLSQQTDYSIWMCDYPKAPESKIGVISENIDEVYKVALETYASNQISFIGDSVGGNLISCLVQRLVTKKKELPYKIILISPVMDASMTNPQAKEIEAIDPMLSISGVVSAKKMCAGDLNLSHKMISPLNGSFKGFPSTVLFLADYDICYPDQILACNKLKNQDVSLEVFIGEGMPHIWPFLPVMKEAKTALKKIIDILNN